MLTKGVGGVFFVAHRTPVNAEADLQKDSEHFQCIVSPVLSCTLLSGGAESP